MLLSPGHHQEVGRWWRWPLQRMRHHAAPCSSPVTAVRWAHTAQCSHWADVLCSYAHISGKLCRKWMGCLSCQVVSIHYAKFLQQNINAAAKLHSEHSDDAVCPCTPSLYLSMDPNITHHTDLKIHLSARQCSLILIHNPKLWWGKAHESFMSPLILPACCLSGWLIIPTVHQPVLFTGLLLLNYMARAGARALLSPQTSKWWDHKQQLRIQTVCCPSYLCWPTNL